MAPLRIRAWLVAAVVLACAAGGGCATAQGEKPPEKPPAEQAGRPTLAASQAQSLQSAVMAMADVAMQRISSGLDLSQPGSPETRRDEIAVRLTLSSALVAIASEPDPVDALADMLTHTTLTAEAQRAAVKGKPAGFDARLLRALELNEADAWRLAEKWVNPQTLAAFRERILAWPGERKSAGDVAFVRLTDLNRTGATKVSTGEGTLDALRATTKTLDESRLLAERALYLTQRMPYLLRWHAEVFTSRALATHESQQAQAQLQQVTEVLNATTPILQGMVDGLSKERAAALADAFDRTAKERKATLDQLTEIVEKERKATLAETNAAIDAQRTALFKDLGALLDQAQRTGGSWIGYVLLTGVILIVVFLAGLLGMLLLYRRLAPRFERR